MTADSSARKKRLKPSERFLGVHSTAEFHAIVKYERARADRANSQFALVAVDSRFQPGDKRELAKLIGALQQRIRSTDVLGWLDDQTLSVLLPGTDFKGAWAFAGTFQKQLFAGRPPVAVTVYCYPDHWLQAGTGSHTGKREGLKEKDSGFGRVQRAIENTLARKIPIWKRSLDIAVSLIALILSSPVFLLLAVYIKIVSRGSAFYKQQRVGYRAAPFTFLKFRTMHPNNDTRCHQLHVKDLINSDKPMEKLDIGCDSRIIPGGRIIRKSCIDELPQLFNVLKGEMSLVGPRPCLPYEAEEYLRWHSHRFDVKPGLTGIWQVSGKNRLTFKQMVRLDISYCQNMSFWLDLKVILLTFPTVAGLIFDGIKIRLKKAYWNPPKNKAVKSFETGSFSKSIVEHI